MVSQTFIFSALIFDPDLRIFLLWSCNNFCILLAIASFRRNVQMLMGISYLGLVAQLLWIADFMSGWVGFNLSGVADYIYKEGFTYANDVSIFVHLIIPIVILVFTIKVKPQPISILYALPYIFFIYITTILFTPPIEDINCVYLACGNDQYVPYAMYLWPIYAILSTIASYAIHLFTYYGWQLSVKRNRPFPR